MTGLDARTERLLEVACIVTDGDLQPVDEGVSYAIATPAEVLGAMDEWCTTTHKSTGLTDACLAPDAPTHDAVRTALLAYVLDRVPDRKVACLAGNTVHADKLFLAKEMPELVDHLHYRIVDASTVKEVVRRWYGDAHVWRPPRAAVRHRAWDDIRASIAGRSTAYNRVGILPPNGVFAEGMYLGHRAPCVAPRLGVVELVSKVACRADPGEDDDPFDQHIDSHKEAFQERGAGAGRFLVLPREVGVP